MFATPDTEICSGSLSICHYGYVMMLEFVSAFQTVSSINTLLEKADRLYKQLQHNKPTLEILLIRISEHSSDRLQVSRSPCNAFGHGIRHYLLGTV